MSWLDKGFRYFCAGTLLFMVLLTGGCSMGQQVQTTEAPADLTKNVVDHPDWPDSLVMLSGPYGGTWYRVGRGVSTILKYDLIETIPTEGGGVRNVEKLCTDEADIGLSAAVLGMPAQMGEAPFSWRCEGAMGIANLYRQYFYCLVRDGEEASPDFRSWFKQHPAPVVGVLERGTVSEFITTEALREIGLTYDSIQQAGGRIVFTSYAGGGALLARGEIDCLMVTLSAPADFISRLESEVGDLRILPVDQTIRDRLSARIGTTSHIIPSGMYGCAMEDTPVIGDFTVLLANDDLPDDLVYEILRRLFDERDTLRMMVPAIEELTLRDAANTAGFPLHPGASKFFREKGSF